MTNDDTDEQDNEALEDDHVENRRRGFHLEIGLQPISDLLGNLIDVDMRESPPPTEWTAAAEQVESTVQDDETRVRNPSKRTRKVTSDDYLIDTRFEDDEFIITADIPRTSKEDVSVGISPKSNHLVISRADVVIGRVKLPWISPETTTAWFQNGILEVRLQASESD